MSNKISEVLGISEEEYQKLFEKYFKELMRCKTDSADKLEGAEKLLQWFITGTDTERDVKAVVCVSVIGTVLTKESAERSDPLGDLKRRLDELDEVKEVFTTMFWMQMVLMPIIMGITWDEYEQLMKVARKSVKRIKNPRDPMEVEEAIEEVQQAYSSIRRDHAV